MASWTAKSPEDPSITLVSRWLFKYTPEASVTSLGSALKPIICKGYPLLFLMN